MNIMIGLLCGEVHVEDFISVDKKGGGVLSWEILELDEIIENHASETADEDKSVEPVLTWQDAPSVMRVIGQFISSSDVMAMSLGSQFSW